MPEPRRPTDRAQAWDKWRRRLAGEVLTGHFDEPECGWYRAKRQGRWVAVQIDLIQDIDEAGELIADERFVAFVDRDSFYDERVFDVWIRCCGHPISEEEAARLLNMPVVSDLSRTVIV